MKEFFNLSTNEVERYKVLDNVIKEAFIPLIIEAVENHIRALTFYTNACEILGREYWRRVWIVQEIIMSPNIVFQCGKSTLAYPTLYAGVRYIRLLSSRIVTWQMERIGGIRNIEPEALNIFQFAISLGTVGE